jgi:hypothetical protein
MPPDVRWRLCPTVARELINWAVPKFAAELWGIAHRSLDAILKGRAITDERAA